MTTGIREFCNARFVALLPQRKELGNTEFRKSVMADVVIEFGITTASAATHYNHSLKMQRAADPKSVEDLGRPESKKGGRHAIHTVDVIKVKTGEVIASGISKAKADELIIQAATKKKARLAIKVVEPVAEAAAPAAAAEELPA